MQNATQTSSLLHMTEKNKEHFTEDSHAEKTKRQQNNLLNGK